MNLSRPTNVDFAIVAHRGAKGHAPENTMASFARAIELGANMLELDVHVTKDKQLVVIHDAAVDRTTDGRGFVSDLTLAEVQALDAGRWFQDEFIGERVPTLQQVLELAKGRVQLNIELKAGGMKPNLYLYPDVVALLADELTRSGMVEEVVVSSFDRPYLAQLKEVLPEVRVALLHHKPIEDFERLPIDLGCESVHTSVRLIDAEFIERAHAAGLKVRAWNPNDAATMANLIALGVDGVITDYPDVLLRVARECGVV